MIQGGTRGSGCHPSRERQYLVYRGTEPGGQGPGRCLGQPLFQAAEDVPTQEIKEERPDGSLIVTFRVGNYEAIHNILKSWIPHILILEPKELKKDLLVEMEGWLNRQKRVI